MKYDIILKNGHVIDPSQNISGTFDIGISDGKIGAIKKDIPSEQAKETVDISDKIATPGIIDIHTHIYKYATELGIEPDEVGVYSGVTTLVDAGSSGAIAFPGFKKFIAEPAVTDIYCYLNFGVIGQISLKIGEVQDENFYDIDSTLKVIEENRDIIRGVKLRATSQVMGKLGINALKKAKEVSKSAKLPLMVHVGEARTCTTPPPFSIEEVLSFLDKGDILSHCLSARLGTIFVSSEKAIEAAQAAFKRGVYFDAAHGMNNFSFDIARKAFSKGFDFHSISTDIHNMARNKTVFDMATTMTKYLHLGLSLDDIIRKTTINPARMIKKSDEMGSLRIGGNADISILEIREGSWDLMDSEDKIEFTNKRIIPVLTVKSGKVFEFIYPFAEP